MRLRVVSWNLDSRATGRLDAKVELLRETRPDLALLQEVSRPVYRALLPHPVVHERRHEQPRLFSWGALSTDLTRPRGSEQRVGCAVLGARQIVLLSAALLSGSVFDVEEPQRSGLLRRTMAAQVAVPGGTTLTACSFQARPVRSDPGAHVRPAFHAGIVRWLAATAGPVVLGIDAQAPEVDHPDPRRSVFRSPAGSGEHRLLGPEPGHGLVDVLRRHLGRRPEELARITAQRPGGPLAVSRCLPAGPARHDHIWATPALDVLDVRYLHDEALATGSDHALVLADLCL